MIKVGYSPKMNEAVGDKNTSGGNISLVYETYYHSGMQERIILYAGSSIEMGVTNIDNKPAVKKFWKECEKYISDIKAKDGTGEASYYSYQSNHPKVKSHLANLLQKYRNQLSAGKYDPVSGVRLDK